jgi:glutaredoxin-like protein NrdH
VGAAAGAGRHDGTAVRTVTVYSTPDCMQCRMTVRALQQAGVGYRVVDLSTDAAAREHVRTLGHTAAPVVVVDERPDVHWSGFRRERIAALALGEA